MAISKNVFKKDVLGWSLYDFANTIYSMNIVSLYLKRYIIEDLGYDDRYFDIPFAVSMLLSAFLLPALGAVSDHSTKKKIFLFLFTLACCASVGILAFIPPHMIFLTIILFIIANFSYEGGQPFYNALLYSVAEGERARFVSGIGVALGYVGSILGMIIVMPFVTGAVFSFDIGFIEGGGKSGSFLPTAILFILFALPIFFWVKERKSHLSKKISFWQSYKEVYEGVTATKKYPGVLRFLIADYFFEDAVMTVIINIGIYCSIVLELPEAEITGFLLVSTVSAVIGSFIIGAVSQYVSLKKLINMIVFGWVISLLVIIFSDNGWTIWLIGSLIGILLGGLWTTTRPYLAELVPKEELGRFFGLFALSGRAAAVVGPVIWTTVVYYTRPEKTAGKFLNGWLNLDSADAVKLPYKAAVLSLIVMMLFGLYIFRKLPNKTGGGHE